MKSEQESMIFLKKSQNEPVIKNVFQKLPLRIFKFQTASKIFIDV